MMIAIVTGSSALLVVVGIVGFKFKQNRAIRYFHENA